MFVKKKKWFVIYGAVGDEYCQWEEMHALIAEASSYYRLKGTLANANPIDAMVLRLNAICWSAYGCLWRSSGFC